MNDLTQQISSPNNSGRGKKINPIALLVSLSLASLTVSLHASDTEDAIKKTSDNKHSDAKAQKESESRDAQISWLKRELLIPTSCLANPDFIASLQNEYEKHQNRAKTIELTADQGSGSPNTEQPAKQELTGNVQLISPQLTLAAGQLTFFNDSKDFHAGDRVVIETATGQFAAKEVSGNAETGTANLSESQFRLKINGANGDANTISVDEQQNVELDALSFSTCPAGDDSWRLYADKLSINQEEGWGEADDVTLKVANVPILYLPWLKFPVDDRRHSGVLPPSFSDSERNGFDVRVPIYFNLASNYDLTLTPRYMVERGSLLGSEFRYLTEDSSGEVELEYLNDQKVSNLESSDRWLYQLRHRTDWNNGWRAQIDATGVSDVNYLTDLGSGIGQTNRDQLTRTAELGYFTPNFSTSVRWLQYQPLALSDKPMRLLPQLQLSWRNPNLAEGWQWHITSQYSQFEPDSNPITAASQLPETERFFTQGSFGYRFEAPWGYLEPKAKVNFLEYQFADAAVPPLNETVAQWMIDGGLRFERQWSGGTQILEPRLFVLHNQDNDLEQVGLYDTYLPQYTYQQLFRDNRFSGYDRINSVDQVSLGVTSRWLDTSGRELISMAVGQAFYQDTPDDYWQTSIDQTVKHSSILSQVRWQPISGLSLTGDIAYDPERKETEHGRLSLVYEPSDNFVVNVNHRFVDAAAGFREQSEIGLALPLSHQWQMIARWQYDLLSRESLETMLGLEYQSCCWSLRVVSRRYLNTRLDQNGVIIPDSDGRFNTDIRFEFVLRGLGGGSQKSFPDVLNKAQWNY
ncbi:LPS-assembly protein LptD [Pleionea litopenaei]|uniref:LPS-assembly protein LptD n=1 Tax=Pleionea litopenaei TaxID=3070815 RepID=A0AA51RQC7_9GAMM|nr:LPS assembly protein LptD [Pleionea sp. HL-JVS1]WMS85707.1 LPS assembly protein LptD [Pleionea sp. HL-JVS1]